MRLVYHNEMVVSGQAPGRTKQRSRTRRALIDAARQVFREGEVPSVASAAELAEISRATAYRYFPTQLDLLQSVMEVDVEGVLASIAAAGDDARSRIHALVDADYEMRRKNETQLRTWIALSAERRRRGGEPSELPIPRGGRLRAIDSALEPLADELSRETLHRLRAVLALLVGTESLVILKDLLGLEGDEAKSVIDWAAMALVTCSLDEDP
jgi:AcrR family transcriptional regulator